MSVRAPDVRDRKAIRAAGIDLHRIASDIRARRGIVPADEPPGYLEAFHDALRDVARDCERARDVTCADLKRRTLAAPVQAGDDVGDLARQRAVNALLVTINLHASRNGVDPYEGEWNFRMESQALA